jgi:chaperone required for assembly of F1-ATPase
MPQPPSPDRPKRFYAVAAAGPVEAGWGVLLDGRAVRTPDKARLTLPTEALAAFVAEEWAAQGQSVDLATMPATRLAFSAQDRVAGKRAETAAEVARFAGADLLCYFAEAPQSLVARQLEAWGPLLDWAHETLGLVFERASGIIHRAQPPQTVARVESLALALDDFALAGLAMAAGLFGSAVLALALQRGRLDGPAALRLSHLDEEFQEQLWGVDPEAAVRRGHLTAEAAMLDRWFRALR